MNQNATRAREDALAKAKDDSLPMRERLQAAGDLMNPGGGSLETSAACQALWRICVAQQDRIENLEQRVDSHSKGVPWA